MLKALFSHPEERRHRRTSPKGRKPAPRLIFLSVRRAKKRPTWLSHANWSGQVHVPARPFSHPSLDQCGLMRGVHDEMDVEFARHSGLDLVEELTEFGSTVTSLALADKNAKSRKSTAPMQRQR